MELKWVNTLNTLVKGIGNFGKANPPVLQAVQQLDAATRVNKVLDDKTHELIALAVAVTTRCDGCLSAHVHAAKKAGATKEEIAEALGTAIALNAGAAFVYSTRVMDAYDEMS
ncbi:AhpD family alkylhydroperoxidase [Acinetobacter calcoaceticus]|uniref:AhpD family alkylhydroperoxidase n=1 Tax=Acinetobacter calcoaceticus TaxID=471 RepID=A0A4R1XSL1_ACICA|nr:AhpD family alkylhydroperoxidase [Acinetobacter calcoaceticus]